jgi:nucleotide-binding universal stress UspA family protein
MKILLPVDGSTYTKHMIGYVAAHEELFGPQHEFIFVTVVPLVPPHVTHFVGRAALQGYYKDEADKVLEPVRAFAAQHGWKARFVQLEGAAAEAVAGFADTEKVSLIVMGSHGHSALAGVLLGSVATGVLARCKAPVLLIR